MRQSQFYDGIMMTQRPSPAYFRVGFYGGGFASFLRNKEFVYRGKDYDKLSEFTGRLLNFYPNAQVPACITSSSCIIEESLVRCTGTCVVNEC